MKGNEISSPCAAVVAVVKPNHIFSNEWIFFLPGGGGGGGWGVGNGGTAGEEQVRGCETCSVCGSENQHHTSCCCHGYGDMQADCRCQADNREAQLERMGEGW